MTKTFNSLLVLPAILLGLLIGFSQTVNAQHLEVKNTANGKVRILKAKKTFSFKLSEEDEYKKGKVQSFTDSSLVIFTPDEDDVQLREVKLKDIYAVKKISCLHKTGYVLGGLFIAGGAVALAEAPGIAGDDGSTGLVRALGGAAIVIGVIPYLIKPKEFVQGKNATFTVVK